MSCRVSVGVATKTGIYETMFGKSKFRPSFINHKHVTKYTRTPTSWCDLTKRYDVQTEQGEMPRRLIRIRCQYSSLDRFEDVFDTALHLMHRRSSPVISTSAHLVVTSGLWRKLYDFPLQHFTTSQCIMASLSPRLSISQPRISN